MYPYLFVYLFSLILTTIFYTKRALFSSALFVKVIFLKVLFPYIFYFYSFNAISRSKFYFYLIKANTCPQITNFVTKKPVPNVTPNVILLAKSVLSNCNCHRSRPNPFICCSAWIEIIYCSV